MSTLKRKYPTKAKMKLIRLINRWPSRLAAQNIDMEQIKTCH